MKRFGEIIVLLGVLLLVLSVVILKVPRLVYQIHFEHEVAAASQAYALPRNMILAVMREESHFDQNATSAASARGLMQILPSTAQWIAARRGLPYAGVNLYEPALNIDFGSWYLRYLEDQFHNDTLTLEAYNAGITNVAQWERTKPGNIQFAETDRFVRRVKKTKMAYDALYGEKWEKR